MIVQPDFRGTINAFLRRKGLFILVAGLACAVGAAYLLVTQPLYQSGASLVVRFDNNQAAPNIDRTMNTTQQLGSNERREIIYSDADILRSRDVIKDTINTLGLARVYPKLAELPIGANRKLDEAAELFASNLVVDVGLQSDVINVSYLNTDAVVARDAVRQLLDHFYGQEAAVYANPQLRFAEEESGK